MSMDDEIVLKFAQKLANNEPRVRKKTIKKLRGWLTTKSKYQSGFSEVELLKLWKGLHYCMWMCDKPPVQEELAESVSYLVHVFPSVSSALLFVRAYFEIEIREWALIDRHRLSKFMMLMRHMLHQTFVRLSTAGWHSDDLAQFVSILTETGLISDNDAVPQGLRWHMIDVYLVELAKVGAQTINGNQCVQLLSPYCQVLATAKHKPLVQYILENLIDEIMNQAIAEHRNKHSHNNRENAMESDDIEMVEAEHSEPRLQFDLGLLADRLFDFAKEKTTLTRNRKVMYAKVAQLKNLAAGKFPREKTVEDDVDSDDSIPEEEVQDAEQRLVEMEDDIVIGERSEKVEHKLWKKRKDARGEQDSENDDDQSLDESQQEPTPKKHKPAKNSGGTPSEKKEKNKFKQVEEKKKMKEKKKEKEALNAERKAEKKQKQKKASKSEKNDKVHLRNGGESESQSDSDVDDTDLPSYVISNSNKTVSQKSDLFMFEGGFMDSDEEEIGVNDESEQEKVKKTSSKKNKKLKGGVSVSDAVEISDSDSNSKLEKSSKLKGKKLKLKNVKELDIEAVGKGTKKDGNKKGKKDNAGVGQSGNDSVVKAKKEKRKAKKNNSISEEEDMGLNTMFDSTLSHTHVEPNTPTNQGKDESVTTSGKKKRKKRDSQSDNLGQLEEEVEIYIPNKKYKGQHAEWAKQQANKSSSKETPPFMKFEKNAPTPPAFIRKALVKATPKTEPKKASKKEVSVKAPNSSGKRRVSFGLHKNMAQSTKEYNKSLKSTPDVPFNPLQVPDGGILKTTPKSSPAKIPKARLSFSQGKKTKKGAGKKRASAEEFF